MLRIKTLVLLALLILPALQLKAQFSNLIIFTQEKEPFMVVMSETRQPMTAG